MFWNRHRNAFGKELGDELQDFEYELSRERGGNERFKAVLAWLEKIPKEDRLDCLLMIRLDREQVQSQVSLVSRMVALASVRQKLHAKEQEALLSGNSQIRKAWLEHEIEELRAQKEQREREFDEFVAQLDANAEFLSENGPQLTMRYGKPKDLPELPTILSPKAESAPRWRVRHYAKLFGKECGYEFALLEKQFGGYPEGNDFILDMVEWLSTVEPEDWIPALKLAELKREHELIRATRAEQRKLLRHLVKLANKAAEDQNEDLARHLAKECRTCLDFLDIFAPTEASFTEAIAILSPLEERYGPPPESPPDDETTRPWFR